MVVSKFESQFYLELLCRSWISSMLAGLSMSVFPKYRLIDPLGLFCSLLPFWMINCIYYTEGYWLQHVLKNSWPNSFPTIWPNCQTLDIFFIFNPSWSDWEILSTLLCNQTDVTLAQILMKTIRIDTQCEKLIEYLRIWVIKIYGICL